MLNQVSLFDVWSIALDAWWRFRPRQGLYEVLDYNAELELLDGEGQYAVFTKQMHVRYLQDHIIAYQDMAWGDGDIFAEYRCSPGIAVDRYKEGNRYRVLISLRESKHRGDEDHITIERHIKGGFTRRTEYFQNIVNHRMKKMTISVIFPPDRHPGQLTIVEHQRSQSTGLKPEHFHHLPDGRLRVSWATKYPRRDEIYSLRWV